MDRQQLNIYYLGYESDDAHSPPASSLELQVRLVERDLLTDRECLDMNAMYIEWNEKGKIFLEEEMRGIDLLVQLKLMFGEKYIGSISFPLKEVVEIGKDFKQWLTIFDTPEDDVFDGVLGVSDDENPKIFVGFEIQEESDSSDEEEREETLEEDVIKEKAQTASDGVVSPLKNLDKHDDNEGIPLNTPPVRFT